FGAGPLAIKLMRHQQLEPPVEELRDLLPPALAKILRKMLAKQPPDRYQAPADVVAALVPFSPAAALSTSDPLNFAGRDPQAFLPPKIAVREARKRSAERTAVAIALALLLVISSGIMWLVLSGQDRPATERTVIPPKKP